VDRVEEMVRNWQRHGINGTRLSWLPGKLEDLLVFAAQSS
jgi:hypothetical protein